MGMKGTSRSGNRGGPLSYAHYIAGFPISSHCIPPAYPLPIIRGKKHQKQGKTGQK